MKTTVDLPQDVREHLLAYQYKAKTGKNQAQYSIEKVIIVMLREHKEMAEKLLKYEKPDEPLQASEVT